jgi:thiamine biosynthesis protein ThiS
LAEAGGIQVTVNGEPLLVPASSTVADVIQRLSLDSRRVAVELNLLVLPRAAHSTQRLNHGDQIEIVTFVGGGAC